MSEIRKGFGTIPKYTLPVWKHTFNYDAGNKSVWPRADKLNREVGIQVTCEIQPVSCRPWSGGAVEYYYYVILDCAFSPTNLSVADDSHSKGWYVSSYEIQTGLHDEKNLWVNNDRASLIQSAPPTAAPTGSVTTSLSQTIGGNLGFMGEAPMGGGSISATLGESRTFPAPDVTVTNTMNQADAPPGSRVLFTLRGSSADSSGFPTYYYDLDSPAALGTATFQPNVMEFWNLPKKIGSKFSLQATVTCTIRLMQVTDADTESTKWHDETMKMGHMFECDYAPDPL